MLQLKRWSVTVLLLLLVIASLGFIKFTQIKAAIAFGESFPEANETVEATNVQWSTWQPTVTLVGEVKAQNTIDIRNELEGILTQFNVPSGGKVSKGQLLAQFNVDTETAELQAIEAEIALAKLDVKRFTDLLDLRASSKEQLDRAKAQLAIAQARARGIQANIDKKSIHAPFDAQASIHDWQVGGYIAANTLLVNLVGSANEVWVDFSLPQQYAELALGTLVKINQTTIDAAPIQAELVALNQQLSTSSRTLLARAKMNTEERPLPPGAIVSVLVPVNKPIKAMPVPNEAIRYDAFGTFVYALEKDENDDYRAIRKPVKVIAKQTAISYVSEGLSANELIATVGSSKLRPNILTFITQR